MREEEPRRRLGRHQEKQGTTAPMRLILRMETVLQIALTTSSQVMLESDWESYGHASYLLHSRIRCVGFWYFYFFFCLAAGQCEVSSSCRTHCHNLIEFLNNFFDRSPHFVNCSFCWARFSDNFSMSASSISRRRFTFRADAEERLP
jgi:hypothetical protein